MRGDNPITDADVRGAMRDMDLHGPLVTELFKERDDLRAHRDALASALHDEGILRAQTQAKLAAAEAHQKKLIELLVTRPEHHGASATGACECYACALDRAAKELCKAWDSRDAAIASRDLAVVRRSNAEAERDAAVARAERAEADVHEAYGRLRHTTAIEVERDAAVARLEEALGTLLSMCIDGAPPEEYNERGLAVIEHARAVLAEGKDGR
jgi:hypothetical protein